MTTIRRLLDAEMEDALQRTAHKDFIRSVYRQRTNYLLDLVKQKVFLRNDSVENYVNNVFNGLLAGTDDQSEYVVLIARTQEANAFCYARGIIVVTVGLLGRISTEGELAFTLAHELSHSQLDHVKSGVLTEADLRLQKKSKEQLKQLLSGNVDLSQLQEFRQLVYGVRRHSRERELQADSLGLAIFTDARYDESDALAMLKVLETWTEPKYKVGAELLAPLDDDDFPLQDEYFNEQLSLYRRKASSNFLFSLDSLQSHPEMKQRQTKLQSYFSGYFANEPHHDQSFVNGITTIAEFETVEAAFRNRDYDWCVYHALYLLTIYPNNSFLISRIGAVLVKLYEVKNSTPDQFRFYVSRFTGNYSVEARAINNLLHNLTTKEIGEMAFFLLENPAHFNPDDRSHYYLRWKASTLTNRKADRDEIRDAYKARFGENITAYKMF